MTGWEFVLVLAWLLLPPLLLATGFLFLLHKRNPGRTVRRTIGAVAVLFLVSMCFAVGMIILGPASLNRYLGMRDEPFMWAPFAFIATFLALPFAVWWVSRRHS
ncbi:hypothetical protein [Acidovorax sp. LjRoot74]|jgi:hypothetical protein|uniref:hypothetical protein n=1 Tax=Acidovorax sp. LjRoot74 TaxID=3342337 RepID=UPI003F4F8A03